MGDEKFRVENEIRDGESLSVMAALDSRHGRIDLIVTDPPDDIGEDSWLDFMTPRVRAMEKLLRPGGVIAVCVDHQRLFRLGTLMDEIFKEENRISIINWQKSYALKNATGWPRRGCSAAEYVLVYAKDHRPPQAEAANQAASCRNRLPWPPDCLKLTNTDAPDDRVYAIQSPFTGEMTYPPKGHCWSIGRVRMVKMLEAWGSKYIPKYIGDGRPPALVIRGDLDSARQRRRPNSRGQRKYLRRRDGDDWRYE